MLAKQDICLLTDDLSVTEMHFRSHMSSLFSQYIRGNNLNS